MTTCAVPRCTRSYYGKSYCEMHWRRWSKHGDPNMLGTNGPSPRSLVIRFWEHVTPGAPDECWEWRDAKGWYGRLWVNEEHETVGAHRVSYYLHNGTWPTFACHRCDNPPCVNPAHLFDGESADNARDMAAKGRWHNQHVTKERCKWNHPLSGDNIRIDRHGTRHCRSCARRRNQEWELRKKNHP